MHFTLPKAHCIRCRFRRELCVCAEADRVASKLKLPLTVLLVMHAKENRKASNTGHLARLALPGSELRIHGLPEAPARFDDLLTGPTVSLCLFPSRGGRLLTPELAAEYASRGQRIRLVVPDGNWGQTTRMMKRIPELTQLPRVELPTLEEPPERLLLRQRRNVFDERVSTYEAIAAAAGALFGAKAQATMLELYDVAAFRMMALRGKLKVSDRPALCGPKAQGST
jgi:DTW domain-containing protein YfiP